VHACVILKKAFKLAEGEVDNLIKGKEVIVVSGDDNTQLGEALAASSIVESFTREGEDSGNFESGSQSCRPEQGNDGKRYRTYPD